MDSTPSLDSYPEELLRPVALENGELRELLTDVARDLERLAAHYPQFAPRFLARASRLRARLWGRPVRVGDLMVRYGSASDASEM